MFYKFSDGLVELSAFCAKFHAMAETFMWCKFTRTAGRSNSKARFNSRKTTDLIGLTDFWLSLFVEPSSTLSISNRALIDFLLIIFRRLYDSSDGVCIRTIDETPMNFSEHFCHVRYKRGIFYNSGY